MFASKFCSISSKNVVNFRNDTEVSTKNKCNSLWYRFTRQAQSYQSKTCSETSVLHKRHVYKLLQIIDPLCTISSTLLFRDSTLRSVTVCWKTISLIFHISSLTWTFSGFFLASSLLSLSCWIISMPFYSLCLCKCGDILTFPQSFAHETSSEFCYCNL